MIKTFVVFLNGYIFLLSGQLSVLKCFFKYTNILNEYSLNKPRSHLHRNAPQGPLHFLSSLSNIDTKSHVMQSPLHYFRVNYMQFLVVELEFAFHTWGNAILLFQQKHWSITFHDCLVKHKRVCKPTSCSACPWVVLEHQLRADECTIPAWLITLMNKW